MVLEGRGRALKYLGNIFVGHFEMEREGKRIHLGNVPLTEANDRSVLQVLEILLDCLEAHAVLLLCGQVLFFFFISKKKMRQSDFPSKHNKKTF